MAEGSELVPGSLQQHNDRHSHHLLNDSDDDGGDDTEDAGSIVPDRTGRHHFCRLCLTHTQQLKPLFPLETAPDQNLLVRILDCVDVQITLPDDIKSLICFECVQQIHAFSSFKELCKSNDQLLKGKPFGHGSDDDQSEDGITPDISRVKTEPTSSLDVSLLEKLQEQGIEIETVGQPAIVHQHHKSDPINAEEREAERKAKNAARMRRWRLRQRQKQGKQFTDSQEKILTEIGMKDPAEFNQEDVLQIQQVQEMFAIIAQHQLRQVEAEIKRLKADVHGQPEHPEAAIKLEPEEQEGGESSRQASPTSDNHMASLRRSRAEYMRRWRAKRQAERHHHHQVSSFGFVGRPPTVSPAPGEAERLFLQRNHRAEYMRRWRRERMKQELSPSEFEEWCIKSEQRRRFREWQVKRKSISSAGDETIDGCETDLEKNCALGEGLQDMEQS
ncbi:uncharacterized protein LOC129768298 [Toxorhynchites rutilus septentrionalis]|uniref:uncharacterized protein LOC129768298 n=1 Tax=Toxorhynchites rutilus septentrionalis TaxID=329112 RepID=UPI002478CBE0|nr:uncharacterized protein LOC129768298 [Toxorhynchites rutilus septentrionalis]